MRLQKAIVHEAVALIEKRSFMTLKHFRYTYISRNQSAGAASSENLLSQPVALVKLALFLIEIHRENSKWVGSKNRPLVLLVRVDAAGVLLLLKPDVDVCLPWSVSRSPQAERVNTYLVVGVRENPEFGGQGAKVHFGKASLIYPTASVLATHDSIPLPRLSN